MAKTYEQILTDQYDRIQQAHAYYAAELEAGRLTDDEERINNASDGILALDATLAHLNARANQYVASQRTARPSNEYGLSDEEISVAKASHSGGSEQERIKSYAEQKQKLQYLRATRQYDDTQGQVFKR